MTSIREALEELRQGKRDVDSVMGIISKGYDDIGCAKIDTSRERRAGCPEVILCEGKAMDQIKGIVGVMMAHGSNILATRASREAYEAIREVCPMARYNELARTVSIERKRIERPSTYIAIVTAGTSDLPVAEEALETAQILGNDVRLIPDVGVAGIHRLMDSIDEIRSARVVIVIAGMEGALASVVGGLVDRPVIAVPTSVGYGASFGGLSALLSMLNTCANGVGVVNIDNGFGAGFLASLINRL
ncbi:MAG: nickel pincer cofactor biosynthesis protein LarB [Candidatus Methanofastidiosa archaeon]|nr:nickel pincer cofactor biosynthesis protein LarB [Candidatus Methanofastidiosa archaeon]